MKQETRCRSCGSGSIIPYLKSDTYEGHTHFCYNCGEDYKKEEVKDMINKFNNNYKKWCLRCRKDVLSDFANKIKKIELCVFSKPFKCEKCGVLAFSSIHKRLICFKCAVDVLLEKEVKK